MAAKDLMFKIAILDETEKSLKGIKNNLTSLEKYAQEVQKNIQSSVNALSNLGKNVDIKLPNLDGFVEQVRQVQSLMGKTDAFGIKELDRAFKNLRNISNDIDAGKLTRGFVRDMSDAAKQIEKAIPKIGTASSSSLSEYREQYTRLLTSFTGGIERIKAKINQGGGMELFPSANNKAVLEANIRDLMSVASRMQSQSSNFLGAMNRNLGFEDNLNKIIEKINGITTAVGEVKSRLNDNSIATGLKENSVRDIQAIIDRLGVLKTALDGTHSTRGTGGTQQPAINLNVDEFLAPFEGAQQRIHAIVDQIQKDISGTLKDALNTDLSSSKTIQSLNELVNGLSGLEEKLQSVSRVAQAAQEISGQISKAKSNLSAAANGGVTVTGNNEKGAVNIQQLLRNQEAIDALVVKIQKAKADAANIRSRVADNNGDVDRVDTYIKTLQRLHEMLLTIRNDENLLGQKMMMIPAGGVASELSTMLRSILGQQGG